MSSDTTPESTAVPKLFYTRQECAEALSLSIRTIDSLVASKALLSRRIGRSVRVPFSALQAFARRDHSKIRTKTEIRTPPKVDSSEDGGFEMAA
jgi:excisionase family DNA binding protein